jgi:hypothetical protein
MGSRRIGGGRPEGGIRLYMRRRLHILTLLPVLLAATMWTRSYWRFDFGVAHGVGEGSLGK